MTKAKAKVEFDDSWLTRSEKAIDASGRYARVLCLLLLCASIFSPVLMIGMKAATVNAVPENFCDEFVLDVNGTRECDVDKENTGLYLRSMSVSGRGCAGALSRYQNDAPVISVWASSAVSLNESGVVWYLLSNPSQAGLNTLFPTAEDQWSWKVLSNPEKPKQTPISAVATTPGVLYIVACLEAKPNLGQSSRGMQRMDIDFRKECNNVATWCGSICGYAQKVDAPSCDESTNRIVGTPWVEDTKVECTKIEKKKKGDDDEALGMPAWRRFVNRLKAAAGGDDDTAEEPPASDTDDGTDDGAPAPVPAPAPAPSDDDSENTEDTPPAADDDTDDTPPAADDDGDDAPAGGDDDDGDDDDGADDDDDASSGGGGGNNGGGNGKPGKGGGRKNKDDDDGDDDDEIFVYLHDGDNATWLGNSSYSCVSRWTTGSTTAAGFGVNTLDDYDLAVIVFTIVFDAILLLSFVPVLSNHVKQAHHGIYNKRILRFRYDSPEENTSTLLLDGKVSSLCFTTILQEPAVGRVVDADKQLKMLLKQLESTCAAMINLADHLHEAQHPSVQSPLVLCVQIIDADTHATQRTDEHPTEVVQTTIDEEHFSHHEETRLLRALEQLRLDAAPWFPKVENIPEPDEEGAYHRYYSSPLHPGINFEVHYIRRAADRSWTDNVQYAHAHIRSYVQECLPTVHSNNSKSSGDDDGSRRDTDSNPADGNIIMCFLDEDSVITNPSAFWTTLLGSWYTGGEMLPPDVSKKVMAEKIGARSDNKDNNDHNNDGADPKDELAEVLAASTFDEHLMAVQLAQYVEPTETSFSLLHKLAFDFYRALPACVDAVMLEQTLYMVRSPVDPVRHEMHIKQFLRHVNSPLTAAYGVNEHRCGYVNAQAFIRRDTRPWLIYNGMRADSNRFVQLLHPRTIVRAAFGFLAAVVLSVVLAAPMVALIYTEDATYALGVAGGLSAIIVSTFVFTRDSKLMLYMANSLYFYAACLRYSFAPLLALLVTALTFGLPLLVKTAGHMPVQKEGIDVPYTLLVKVGCFGLAYAIFFSLLRSPDILRNEVLQQVKECLEHERDESTEPDSDQSSDGFEHIGVEECKSCSPPISASDDEHQGDRSRHRGGRAQRESSSDGAGSSSGAVAGAAAAAGRQTSKKHPARSEPQLSAKWLARLRFNRRVKRRSIEDSIIRRYDEDVEVSITRSFRKAITELFVSAWSLVMLMALYPGRIFGTLVPHLYQPRKGRGTSRAARMSLLLTIGACALFNEAFMYFAILQNTRVISPFLSFSLLGIMTNAVAYLWIDELAVLLSPSFATDPQLRKAAKMGIIAVHLIAWFGFAGLI